MIKLILAYAVSSVIAHMCTSALPFQVGSLIDGYGFSATAAGLVGFFQIGSLALSMIFFSPLTRRYRPLPVCLAGMVLAAACNVGIFLLPGSLPLICLLAVGIGIGYGLVLTAAVAAAAASPHPDAIYAAGNSGALVLLIAMLSVLPAAISLFGSRGTFIAIALLIIVSMPVLAGFRARTGAAAETVAVPARWVGVLPLLAIWSLMSFGTGAVWGFAERAGIALPDVSRATVGYILSGSVFAGLLGTGLAALLCDRLNRVTALGIGLIGAGLACLLLVATRSIWVFAAAAALYWVTTMFVYVLLLGAAAAIDRAGRLGTLGTGCERLAFAISAPISGLIADHGSLLWIGVMAAAASALIAPLFLLPLARTLRVAAAHPELLPATGVGSVSP
jgi:predicted MFS family arabinose efflux permease